MLGDDKLKILKKIKRLKNYKKSNFFQKIKRFSEFLENRKKLQVQQFCALSRRPPVNIGAIMGRSWADHGQTLGDKELVGEKLKFASHQQNACSL